MTETTDEQRDPILDAVQTALTEFGLQVKSEIDSLRTALAVERSSREAAEAQVAALGAALETSQQQSTAERDDLHQFVDDQTGAILKELSIRLDACDSKLGELDARTATSAESFDATDTRVTALESWSDSATDAANELEGRLATVETRSSQLDVALADGLAAHTAATDDVAATAADLLATHVVLEGRFDAAESKLQADLDQAVEAVKASAATDFAAAESRLGEQVAAVEKKTTDEAQARFAELDEEFERVAAGVESSMTALNERSNRIDERIGSLSERVTALEAIVVEIDLDVIDELSERVSMAAGEAVLVRIETERFQESVKQSNDTIFLRISELEAQLRAQELDVETAVQLERLEEIERALIELDPAQFVRVDDAAAPSNATSLPAEVPFGGATGETEASVAGQADETNPSKPTLPSSQA